MPDAVTDLMLTRPDLMAGWMVVLMIGLGALGVLVLRSNTQSRSLRSELDAAEAARQQAE